MMMMMMMTQCLFQFYQSVNSQRPKRHSYQIALISEHLMGRNRENDGRRREGGIWRDKGDALTG